VIEFDLIPTPAGICTAEVEAGALVGLHLGERHEHSARRARLPQARRWVADWFRGSPVRVRLKLEVSPFVRRVYGVVRRIPRGKVLSYGEVAEAAGKPGAARAVGNAMARNPICLFIPCHRVVASSGLGGFGGEGGVAQKKLLLGLEGLSYD
jgi:methylated-DNA-[protein]-cysteine S-methyltransferase